MNPTRGLGQILRAALAALLCAACSAELSDDTWVAQVDDAQIRFGELRSRMAETAKDIPEGRREDVLNHALNQLVSDQVVLNRARNVGIEVLDEEIDARLRRLHGSEIGVIDASYREDVRRQMTLDRATLFDLAERVKVPENSVSLYYAEHKDRYHVPAKVRIRQIVVEEREKAEELLQKLKAGGDFEDLAKEQSLGPEASDGGLLPPFTEGELPEAFDEAFKLKKGLSPVIESPYGFHIFKLEAKLKAREREFHEVREEIVLDLERKRLAELRREWLRGLRRSADIRVNDELLETLR